MFRHKTLQSHRIWTRQDENFELRPLSAAVLLHSDQDHSDWCDFALWPRSLRLVWFCTLIKITQTGVILHSHQDHPDWCDFALSSRSPRPVWLCTLIKVTQSGVILHSDQDHSDWCDFSLIKITQTAVQVQSSVEVITVQSLKDFTTINSLWEYVSVKKVLPSLQIILLPPPNSPSLIVLRSPVQSTDVKSQELCLSMISMISLISQLCENTLNKKGDTKGTY